MLLIKCIAVKVYYVIRIRKYFIVSQLIYLRDKRRKTEYRIEVDRSGMKSWRGKGGKSFIESTGRVYPACIDMQNL